VGISAEFPLLVTYTGELCSEGGPLPCPVAYLGGGSSGTATANVQISAVSVSPTTINTQAEPTSAIVTVQITHQEIASGTEQTVYLQVGTYSTSPPGATLSYNPATQQVAISGAQGVANAQVEVSAPGCPSGSSSCTITIYGSLSNPSSGLTIVAPSPATAAQTTLTVNVK
jgi:hypothetical protein